MPTTVHPAARTSTTTARPAPSGLLSVETADRELRLEFAVPTAELDTFTVSTSGRTLTVTVGTATHRILLPAPVRTDVITTDAVTTDAVTTDGGSGRCSIVSLRIPT